MSYVYIGTDSFAAAVLKQLTAQGHSPSLVISRPDAPKGRGRKLSPPPVAEAASELGLDLIQPEDIGSSEVDAAIDATSPAALALCAYGAIVREPLLSKRPILNLHPSLLPRWRGATPIERAIMNGDEETGVSIIKLVEELDAGPVLEQKAIPIGLQEDFASLSARLVDLGSELLSRAIAQAESGTLEFAPQPDSGVTYAERLEAPDRFINDEESAVAAERKVRALTPHIGARLSVPDGDPIGVKKTTLCEMAVGSGVVTTADGELLVGYPEGTLRIDRLVPPGGKEMDAADWLRGR